MSYNISLARVVYYIKIKIINNILGENHLKGAHTSWDTTVCIRIEMARV